MNFARSVVRCAIRSFSSMAGSALPKSKVELHIHLDGSVRTSTLLDIANRRGMKLPVATVDELKAYTCFSALEPHSLTKFLDTFYFFLPILRGDTQAIERIAYEFCEDQANQGVVYCEARYAPHLLASTVDWSGCLIHEYESEEHCELDKSQPPISPREVVLAVNAGLSRGCKDFGVMTRSILCCMTHRPDWSAEVVDLAHAFRNDGVVAIDLAGDENNDQMVDHAPAFLKAKELNIHRTVHAGEVGPPDNVSTAIDTLHAERIGHGYSSVKDQAVYQKVKDTGVHLEACLFSSLLTGGVREDEEHPVKKWATDGVNFSLSTDDPGVMQCTLQEEYLRAQVSLGLDVATLARLNFNAARSCFLPEDEKQQLIKQLKTTYGMGDV